jgi:quercetin dioxygenase-like cupin family protein
VITAEVRHYHRQSTQFFYVLTGTLSIEADGTVHVLTGGQGLQVDAGQVHEVRNRSVEHARFLVVSSPPSHADRYLVPSTE